MFSDNAYQSICDFTPTLEQSKIFNVLIRWDTSKNPLILKLPCGYGKTESVIVPIVGDYRTLGIAPPLAGGKLLKT
jgi:CRISPR/Cas system-associated endonuclease/helicase Cas3